MTLTAEDIKILTIEKEIHALSNIKNSLPNGAIEAHEKIHKKMERLWSQQNLLIYDARGNYRNDKRHLLSGASLDLTLLEIRP